jgi:cytochrome P450
LSTTPNSGGGPIPKASALDTLALAADVAVPTVAKGAIIRRPRIVALAERLNLGKRAIRRMQRLRAKYGPGPLLLSKPGQARAVMLAAEHVHRVLDCSPDPFATASREKRAALAHFEPKNALISHGALRTERRKFNEEVLETNRTVHHLAERFLAVVHQEAGRMLSRLGQQREFGWDEFIGSWYRLVRRIVLGDTARDDHQLTDQLALLRYRANWAFFRPVDKHLRDRFHAQLEAHLARGEIGSLSELIAAIPNSTETAPSHQVAQWLFAFDPAGMATFRALALLAAHPAAAQRARLEIAGRLPTERQQLPFLRACFLESLRLWPTTPMVLRETTRETVWSSGIMPAGTGILIFAPFFHRDDERLPYADRFVPELWLESDQGGNWPLIPFSKGPGLCPAHNLVPLIASAMLAALIEAGEIRLVPPERLDPDDPLPGELNNYDLRFALG